MRRQAFQMALGLIVLGLWAFGQSSRPQKATANGGDFSNTVNPPTKVPKGVILVKGAWSSASDSTTPVPEGSKFTNSVFSNPYFGISYNLPSGWTKGYDGPPPSDRGRYVLAQIRPAEASKGSSRGSILITAEDMFFTPMPSKNTLQLINYMKNHLQAEYKQEEAPMQTKMAGRLFTFFAYGSQVAQLHWYVMATQIRCHAVEMVLTSRDTKLLGNLVLDLNKMKLPAGTGPTDGMGGGPFPVCMKDYARDANLITRVDPVFTEHRVNPVPVRIIIDTKGRVRHVHFLSAFPDQARAVTDVLRQWKFKPYLQSGRPVEVETGIMFGRAPASTTRSSSID